MGCEFVQGFLLGRQASAETFARTLIDSRRATAQVAASSA
jgi:EAL domain-containing protein (putative c-di-GMP-specific phosphodiesterase class I)